MEGTMTGGVADEEDAGNWEGENRKFGGAFRLEVQGINPFCH